MIRRFALIATAALALLAPGLAAASTIDDLRNLGMTVQVSSDLGDGCLVYVVSGPGVQTYLPSTCSPDFQAAVDSLADPDVAFERAWQANHPDQVEAAQTIAGSCYSITRTAPRTDGWRVVGGLADVTTDGAGLPELARTLPPIRLQDGSCPAGTVTAITPSVDQAGTVTAPGAAATLAAVALTPLQTALQVPQAITGTAPADTDSTVVPASKAVSDSTSIVGWLNTPYMSEPLSAP